MFRRRKDLADPATGRRPYARPNLAPATFSYHANRSTGIVQSQERNIAVASRGKRIHWSQMPTIMATAAILVAVVYSTTLGSRARVSIIDQNSATLLRPTATYESATNALLKSSFWNGSKLTVDTVKIGGKLQEQFPELTEVSMTIPLLGRQPTLQLVAELPVLLVNVDGIDYYVSSSGRAVMRVQDAAERPSVPRLVDQVGLSAKVGEQLLPRDTIGFTKEIMRQMSAKQVTVDELILPAIPNELHVKVSGQQYYIKFATLGDARLQAGTYLAVANHLRDSNTTPREYVDVRVEERAFYK